ncbi:hypothetical protein [Paraburkholderia tropica]|uniref:hypothetical protein n=1 Tax=Paraburkholderia tropica TaxID=92647 RepID=UPI003D28FCD2
MHKDPTLEATKPHPLVTDYWLSDDDQPHSVVNSEDVADVSRATDAIRTMVRIVHNSLSEPDMSGAQPLDRGSMLALLSGVEILSKFVFQTADEMRSTAAQYEKFVGPI